MSDRPPKVRLTSWASCAGCAAKMDALLLADALKQLPRLHDPNVLVGPETADDAGVYRIAENLALVNTVDFFPPVVDDPFTYGQVAAANALSDIYAMGGRPVTALNLVGFPRDGLDPEILYEILRGGAAKLVEAGVALVGGHSVVDAEVKYGLAITGLVDPAHMVTNAGARPGDLLVLTKPIGLGIITTAIKQGRADPTHAKEAADVMVQLNRRAAELMLEFGARACTDITGYGLLGHALEMAAASGVRLEIEHSRVPHFPAALDLYAEGMTPGGLENNRRAFSGKVRFADSVSAIWRDLLFDPQTSGGLLIALPETNARDLLQKLAGEDAALIGRVTVQGEGGVVVV